MKNRRSILIALLLCACLIIGVGYAALTQDLAAEGIANISLESATKEFDEDVYFSGLSNFNNISGSVDANDNDVVNLRINNGLGVIGDTASVDLKIKNVGNAPVTITVNAMTGNTSYFSVTTDASSYTIMENSEVTVKLIVTLQQTIVEDLVDSDIPFGITFTAISS